MRMEKVPALMAFAEDIRNRGFSDWLRAHTSFMKPLHRYDGELTLTEDELRFRGRDTKKKGVGFQIEITRKDVKEVFLGFDDVFRRGESRGAGMGYHPLRVRFARDGRIEAMYLITDFRRFSMSSANEEWEAKLKAWVKG